MKLSIAPFAALLVCVASEASAIEVYKDEEHDRSLSVGALLQPQAQITQDGAPNGKSASTDLFLRRARLIVQGQVMKGLTFFVDTDQPNWGKNGAWDGQFFVQDAFASYEVRRELTIDAGMMLVPLTRHTLEGAASLHAIDYHAALIHYPANMGKIFRDAGVQLRGLAFDDRVHYRVGVFEGVRGPALPANAPAGTLPLNEDGEPRFAAQVRFNALGVEEKFFLSGISFADKPLVSFGLGWDYQRHATRIPTGISNHAAIAGDAYVEYPFSANDELLFKAAMVRWAEGTGSPATGLGAFGEIGFRHDWVEPLVGADWFHAERGLDDYHAIRPGVNFWLRKHTANVKAEAAWTSDEKPSTGAKRDFIATVQGQVFF